MQNECYVLCKFNSTSPYFSACSLVACLLELDGPVVTYSEVTLAESGREKLYHTKLEEAIVGTDKTLTYA